MMVSAETIVSHLAHVPTIKSSVSRLLALRSDPDMGLMDIAKVVETDAALTVNFLRVANSARYGTARRISTVQNALSLMGSELAFSIATSSAFLSVIPDTLPGYGMSAAEFWLHSSTVAVFSHALGESLALPDRDSLFVGGLLHDIGMLVVSDFLASSACEIEDLIGAEDMSPDDREAAILGTDHTDVGYRVISNWHLPPLIADIARYHHHPEEAGKAHARQVAVVHVADALAHQRGLGQLGGVGSYVASPAVLRELGLSQERAEEVADAAQEQLDGLIESLSP